MANAHHEHFDEKFLSSPQGRLFVVSGPSGVGKDTVLSRLHTRMPEILRCVTATTRSPRRNEAVGEDYHFITVEEFHEMCRRGEFLEYAHVNGNYYGTPRGWVESQRKSGRDIILKIDVQGAKNIRTVVPDAALVFLAPPSLSELERRLRSRLTETDDQIAIRLRDARQELAQIPNYDYIVVNENIERAVDQIQAIIIAERCRIRSHE